MAVTAALVSQWLPIGVHPVRLGMYEVRFPNGAIFTLHWNGERWSFPASGLPIAPVSGEWRGLATDPSVP